MPADEAIIQLVQAGQGQEAFERLVPAYRRRVFGLAFSILRDRAEIGRASCRERV